MDEDLTDKKRIEKLEKENRELKRIMLGMIESGGRKEYEVYREEAIDILSRFY